MNKFFNTLYKCFCFLFALCIIWVKSYGGDFYINNVNYVNISKYSDDVHISGTYDCNEFDHFYELFSLAGVDTINLKIEDENTLNMLVNIFKKYNQLQDSEVCNGWSRIKIVFVLDNNEELTFFLEGFGSGFRLLNKENKPEILEDELIKYLHGLGGFR